MTQCNLKFWHTCESSFILGERSLDEVWRITLRGSQLNGWISNFDLGSLSFGHRQYFKDVGLIGDHQIQNKWISKSESLRKSKQDKFCLNVLILGQSSLQSQQLWNHTIWAILDSQMKKQTPNLECTRKIEKGKCDFENFDFRLISASKSTVLEFEPFVQFSSLKWWSGLQNRNVHEKLRKTSLF